jgi:hypothetical protein
MESFVAAPVDGSVEEAVGETFAVVTAVALEVREPAKLETAVPTEG